MEIKLIQETCCADGCGVPFWMDENFRSRLVSTKRTFYCPNGHPQSYQGESDKAKAFRIANEKAALERSMNTEIERLRNQLKRKCPKKAK